eukprot:TRINITY_DN5495_c5_g1_i1.p1 TRINITY_DN5495_c5_g1~~TRINITY_DN5495_c5_g1_i1.p1  ORF type:complete len:452 (+),score=118.50 TRINITY_DN5495_c5_g1_i1:80-1435(+)
MDALDAHGILVDAVTRERSDDIGDEWMYELQKQERESAGADSPPLNSSEEAADDATDGDASEKSFAMGMVDGDLLGVLYRVGIMRGWSDKQLANVCKKLHTVGALTSDDLMIMINCGVVNQRLRLHGFKAFSKETLLQCQALLGLGKRVRGVLATHRGVERRAFRRLTPCPDDNGFYLAEGLYGDAGDTNVYDAGLTAAEQAAINAVSLTLSASPMLARDVSFAFSSFRTYESSSVRESSMWTVQAGEEEPEDVIALARFPDWDDVAPHLPRNPTYARDEWRVVQVPLEWLYYYQTTIAGAFGASGGLLQRTIDELRDGAATPYTLPLMHVVAINGVLYGMGCRRLLCFMHVWGMTEPGRMIPVLFNGRATEGIAPNPTGMSMKVLGMASLDGVIVGEVTRPRRCWTSPQQPSFQHMIRLYSDAELPMERDGKCYVDFTKSLTPHLLGMEH